MHRVDNELRNFSKFLPLGPKDFQVLLMLLEQPLHGYGIVQASGEGAGKSTLELGSLYRIISRMMKRGLIEEVSLGEPDSKRKRRYYAATGLGRRVAQAEAQRLRALLESKLAVRLLGER